jgi:nucleoside-diphosphate-sugar epimerase
VYNIACGRRTTLLDLVARINSLLGTAIQPEHGPARPGDVRHSQADISRAVADLGYKPTTDVRRGLARCLEWWRQREGRRVVRV